eukprot:PhM_4_TR2133/c0_g1_i1/m.54182
MSSRLIRGPFRYQPSAASLSSPNSYYRIFNHNSAENGDHQSLENGASWSHSEFLAGVHGSCERGDVVVTSAGLDAVAAHTQCVLRGHALSDDYFALLVTSQIIVNSMCSIPTRDQKALMMATATALAMFQKGSHQQQQQQQLSLDNPTVAGAIARTISHVMGRALRRDHTASCTVVDPSVAMDLVQCCADSALNELNFRDVCDAIRHVLRVGANRSKYSDQDRNLLLEQVGRMPPMVVPAAWNEARLLGYKFSEEVLDRFTRLLLKISSQAVNSNFYEPAQFCKLISDVCRECETAFPPSDRASTILTRAVTSLRHSRQWRMLTSIVLRLFQTPHANRMFRLKAVAAVGYCSHHIDKPPDDVVRVVKNCMECVIEAASDRDFLGFSAMNRSKLGDAVLMMSKTLFHAQEWDTLRTLFRAVSAVEANVYFAILAARDGHLSTALTQMAEVNKKSGHLWKTDFPATVMVALHDIAELLGRKPYIDEALNFLETNIYLKRGNRSVRAHILESIVKLSNHNGHHHAAIAVGLDAVTRLSIPPTYPTLQFIIRSASHHSDEVVARTLACLSAVPTTSTNDWFYDEVVTTYLDLGQVAKAVALLKQYKNVTTRFMSTLGRLYQYCSAEAKKSEGRPDGVDEWLEVIQTELRRRGLGLGTQHSSVSGTTSSAPSSARWTCVHCSHANPQSADECAKCTAHRESHWECVVCRHINPGRSAFCVLCDSMKSLDPKLIPARAWVCGSCSRANPATSPLECLYCNAPSSLGVDLQKHVWKCSACGTRQDKGMLRPWCSSCGVLHVQASKHDKSLWECPRCQHFNAWIHHTCTRCAKVPYDEAHRTATWAPWECIRCTASNPPTRYICACGQRRISRLPESRPDELKDDVLPEIACRTCHTKMTLGALAVCDACFTPKARSQGADASAVWLCTHPNCLHVNYSSDVMCRSCGQNPAVSPTVDLVAPSSEGHPADVFSFRFGECSFQLPSLSMECGECGHQNSPGATWQGTCESCLAPGVIKCRNPENPSRQDQVRIALFVSRVVQLWGHVDAERRVAWLCALAGALSHKRVWELIRPNHDVANSIGNFVICAVGDIVAELSEKMTPGTTSVADRRVLRLCLDIVDASVQTEDSRDVIGPRAHAALHTAVMGDDGDLKDLKVQFLVHMKLERRHYVLSKHQNNNVKDGRGRGRPTALSATGGNGAKKTRKNHRCSCCLGNHPSEICPEVLPTSWKCPSCAADNKGTDNNIEQYVCKGCARVRPGCTTREVSLRTWSCPQCHRWNLHVHTTCAFCESGALERAPDPAECMPCTPAKCKRCNTVHLEPSCPVCHGNPAAATRSGTRMEPLHDVGVVLQSTDDYAVVSSVLASSLDAVLPRGRMVGGDNAVWPLELGTKLSFVIGQSNGGKTFVERAMVCQEIEI